MKVKITGKFVVGFDGRSHVIYKNGAVVYENDIIRFVGHECTYTGEVDEVVNAGDALISPGFIDLDPLGDMSHAHIIGEMDPKTRGRLGWSEDYFLNHRQETMSPENEDFKSLYAYSHLVYNGITTAMPITSTLYKKNGQTYDECASAARNGGRLGLRIYLGQSYTSAKNVLNASGSTHIRWIEEEGWAGLESAVQFAKDFGGAYDGLIQPVLIPERVENQTRAILEASKKFANELGCPIRLHAAQNAFEYRHMREKHGKSTIAYLRDIGFLDEHTLIAHGIYASGYSRIDDASDDDLDILCDTGASVIHCPVLYARLGEALESFGRYQRKGINMAMGTDTFPADMIENIRLGSYVARLMDGEKPENNFSAFYNAATLGGAAALGRDDLGRLCEGAKADIIIIDLSGYHIGIIDDPIRTVFMSASGRDVKTSIINGRFVMRDRIIPGFDIVDAQQKGQAYFNKLKQGYLDRSGLSPDEAFRPSFPILLK